jgi:hypothetical protein
MQRRRYRARQLCTRVLFDFGKRNQDRSLAGFSDSHTHSVWCRTENEFDG